MPPRLLFTGDPPQHCLTGTSIFRTKTERPHRAMTKLERETLEQFAKAFGIAFAWKPTHAAPNSRIVFSGSGGTDLGSTFEEFWDAMHYLVVTPAGEAARTKVEETAAIVDPN